MALKSAFRIKKNERSLDFTKLGSDGPPATAKPEADCRDKVDRHHQNRRQHCRVRQIIHVIDGHRAAAAASTEFLKR